VGIALNIWNQENTWGYRYVSNEMCHKQRNEHNS